MPRRPDAPPPPDPPAWLAMPPEGRPFEVRGHTRGEAKAAAKRLLRIPRHDRLPRGIGLRRVNQQPTKGGDGDGKERTE
jgi:hypothetical protein